MHKTAEQTYLTFDGLVRKAACLAGREDTETLLRVWTDAFLYTEEQTKAGICLIFNDLFAVHRNKQQKCLAISFCVRYLANKGFTQSEVLPPRFLPTAKVSVRSLSSRYGEKEEKLFSTLMECIGEGLGGSEEDVEVELRFFGKVFRKKSELLFVSQTQIPSILLGRCSLTQMMLLRSAEVQIKKEQLEDAQQKEQWSRNDQRPENVSTQIDCLEGKKMRKPTIRLRTKVPRFLERVETVLGQGSSKQSIPRLDKHPGLKNQKKILALTHKEILKSKLPSPDSCEASHPPLIDDFAPTRSCPLTVLPPDHSVSARIASNYSPLAVVLAIDHLSKRLKLSQLDLSEIIPTPRPENEFGAKRKSLPFLDKSDGTNQASDELNSLSKANYNSLVTEVLRDEDVMEGTEERARVIVTDYVSIENSPERKALAETLVTQIAEDMRHSLKTAVLDYILKDFSQRKRLGIILPPTTESEYGKSLSSSDCPSLGRSLAHITTTLDKKLFIFSKQMYQISASYDEFIAKSLFCFPEKINRSNLTPLHDFITSQRVQMEEILDSFAKRWNSAAVEVYHRAAKKISSTSQRRMCDAASEVIGGRLRELILKSFSHFSSFINRYLDQEKASTWSFLVVKVLRNEKGIMLEFSLDEMIERLESLIRDVLIAASSIPRPVEASERESRYLRGVSPNEAEITSLMSAIKCLRLSVKAKLDRVDEVIELIEDFLDEGDQLSEVFSNEDLPRDVLVSRLQHYHQLRSAVEIKIPDSIPLLLFSLDFKELKANCVEVINQCHKICLERAQTEIARQIALANRQLKTATEGIVPIIETAAKLVELEARIEAFYTLGKPQLSERLSTLLDWTLEFAGYPEVINEERVRELVALRLKMIVLESDFDRKKQRIVEDRTLIERQLETRRMTLVEEAKKLWQAMEIFKQQPKLYQHKTVLQDVNSNREVLNSLMKELVAVKEQEVILGINVLFLPKLSETDRLLRIFEGFWSTVSSWAEQKKIYETSSVFTLKTEELTSNVERWVRGAEDLLTECNNDASFAELISPCEKIFLELKELKDDIGLIQSLNTKGLTPRHWQAINTVLRAADIQTHIEPMSRPVPSLMLLRQTGICRLAEQIETITRSASAEWLNEQKLSDIEQSWSSLRFKVPILFDEYITKAEDDLISLQKIGFTAAQDRLLHQLDGLAKKIIATQSVLQAWKHVEELFAEAKKLYGIFDVPQILGPESAKFSETETAYQKFFAEKIQSTSVLTLSLSGGTLRRLSDWAAELEKVIRSFEAYYARKRFMFPRFYFLSNNQIATIGNCGLNLAGIRPFLRALFPAVDSFIHTSEATIEAFTSCDGERIELQQPVPFVLQSEQFEVCFQQLEAAMHQTVRFFVLKAFEDYIQNAVQRSEIITSRPGQASIAVLLVDLTMMMEQALEVGEHEGLMEFLTEINDSLKSLGNLQQLQASGLPTARLKNAITILISKRDLASQILSASKLVTNAFYFEQSLRYYLKEDVNHDLLIRMGSYTFEYGYEYIGNHSRMTSSPQTDRALLALAANVGNLRPSLLLTSAEAGSSSLLAELAASFARYCCWVQGYCSLSRTKQLLLGTCGAGAWIFFDRVTFAPPAIGFLANQMVAVKSALNESRTELFIDSVSSRLAKSAAFFFVFDRKVTQIELLKGVCRTIHLVAPSREKVVATILAGGGLDGSAQKAQIIVEFLDAAVAVLPELGKGKARMTQAVSVAIDARRRALVGTKVDISIFQACLSPLAACVSSVEIPKLLNLASQILLPGLSHLTRFAELKDWNEALNLPSETGALSRTMSPSPFFKVVCGLQDAKVRQIYLGLVDNCKAQKVEPSTAFLEKLVILKNLLECRPGVLLLGSSCTGKSSAVRTLSTYLNVSVRKLCLSWPVEALLGSYCSRPGLISKALRKGAEESQPTWLWMAGRAQRELETIRSLFSENSQAMLPTSEIVSLTKEMRIIFETTSVAELSPSFVSCLPTIYFGNEILSTPAAASQLATEIGLADPRLRQTIDIYVQAVLAPLLNLLREREKYSFLSSEAVIIHRMGRIVRAAIGNVSVSQFADKKESEKCVAALMIFATVWGVGSLLPHLDRALFDVYLKNLLQSSEKSVPTAVLKLFSRFDFPDQLLLFDYDIYIRPDGWEWRIWASESTGSPALDQLSRAKNIIHRMCSAGLSVCVIGQCRTGKSTLAMKSAQSLNGFLLSMMQSLPDENLCKYIARCRRVKFRPLLVVDDLNMKDKEATQDFVHSILSCGQMAGESGTEPIFIDDFHLIATSRADSPKSLERFERYFVMKTLPEAESMQHALFTARLTSVLVRCGAEDKAGAFSKAAHECQSRAFTFLSQHSLCVSYAEVEKVCQYICNSQFTSGQAVRVLIEALMNVYGLRLPTNQLRLAFFRSVVTPSVESALRVSAVEVIDLPKLWLSEEEEQVRAFTSVEESRLMQRISMSNAKEPKMLAGLHTPNEYVTVARLGQSLRTSGQHVLLSGATPDCWTEWLRLSVCYWDIGFKELNNPERWRRDFISTAQSAVESETPTVVFLSLVRLPAADVCPFLDGFFRPDFVAQSFMDNLNDKKDVERPLWVRVALELPETQCAQQALLSRYPTLLKACDWICATHCPSSSNSASIAAALATLALPANMAGMEDQAVAALSKALETVTTFKKASRLPSRGHTVVRCLCDEFVAIMAKKLQLQVKYSVHAAAFDTLRSIETQINVVRNATEQLNSSAASESTISDLRARRNNLETKDTEAASFLTQTEELNKELLLAARQKADELKRATTALAVVQEKRAKAESQFTSEEILSLDSEPALANLFLAIIRQQPSFLTATKTVCMRELSLLSDGIDFTTVAKPDSINAFEDAHNALKPSSSLAFSWVNLWLQGIKLEEQSAQLKREADEISAQAASALADSKVAAKESEKISRELCEVEIRLEAHEATRKRFDQELANVSAKESRWHRLKLMMGKEIDEAEARTLLHRLPLSSMVAHCVARAAYILYASDLKISERRSLWSELSRSLGIEGQPELFSFFDWNDDNAFATRLSLFQDPSLTENAAFTRLSVAPVMLVDGTNRGIKWLHSLPSAAKAFLGWEREPFFVKARAWDLEKRLDFAAKEGIPVVVEEVTEPLAPEIEAILCNEFSVPRRSEKLHPNFRLILSGYRPLTVPPRQLRTVLWEAETPVEELSRNLFFAAKRDGVLEMVNLRRKSHEIELEKRSAQEFLLSNAEKVCAFVIEGSASPFIDELEGKVLAIRKTEDTLRESLQNFALSMDEYTALAVDLERFHGYAERVLAKEGFELNWLAVCRTAIKALAKPSSSVRATVFKAMASVGLLRVRYHYRPLLCCLAELCILEVGESDEVLSHLISGPPSSWQVPEDKPDWVAEEKWPALSHIISLHTAGSLTEDDYEWIRCLSKRDKDLPSNQTLTLGQTLCLYQLLRPELFADHVNSELAWNESSLSKVPNLLASLSDKNTPLFICDCPSGSLLPISKQMADKLETELRILTADGPNSLTAMRSLEDGIKSSECVLFGNDIALSGLTDLLHHRFTEIAACMADDSFRLILSCESGRSAPTCLLPLADQAFVDGPLSVSMTIKGILEEIAKSSDMREKILQQDNIPVWVFGAIACFVVVAVRSQKEGFFSKGYCLDNFVQFAKEISSILLKEDNTLYKESVERFLLDFWIIGGLDSASDQQILRALLDKLFHAEEPLKVNAESSELPISHLEVLNGNEEEIKRVEAALQPFCEEFIRPKMSFLASAYALQLDELHEFMRGQAETPLMRITKPEAAAVYQQMCKAGLGKWSAKEISLLNARIDSFNARLNDVESSFQSRLAVSINAVADLSPDGWEAHPNPASNAARWASELHRRKEHILSRSGETGKVCLVARHIDDLEQSQLCWSYKTAEYEAPAPSVRLYPQSCLPADGLVVEGLVLCGARVREDGVVFLDEISSQQSVVLVSSSAVEDQSAWWECPVFGNKSWREATPRSRVKVPVACSKADLVLTKVSLFCADE